MSFRLSRDYRKDPRRPPKPDGQDAGRDNGAGEIEYVYNELFEADDAEEQLWGEQAEEVPAFRYSLGGSTRVGPAKSLTRDQERTLFLRYNYAKYRLARLRRGRRKADDENVRLWRKRAEGAREQLVHANLPLVPSMAKYVRTDRVEFSELISEGYMAVLRSIEKFDVSRGYKFSTYACRAIRAAHHRLVTTTHRRSQQVPAYFDPAIQPSDWNDTRHRHQRSEAIEMVQDILLSNEAGLSRTEQQVIQGRFAFTPGNRKRTLKELGKEMGLSDERIRQIEIRALGKLREAFTAA